MKPVEHRLPDSFPENAILIIGAGHFGGRAAWILSTRLKSPLWLFDRDPEALEQVHAPGMCKVQGDGIRFLAENQALLKPSQTIVPAVPCHLAFEWLRTSLGQERVAQVPVPQQIIPLLPHTWAGHDGSLLVSYADFLCPEDCSEPETRCTVTGRQRGVPLHERLARLDPAGYRTHIIRSRQLAPGVGGYPLAELTTLLGRLQGEPPGARWLIGTACRCHGILTALSSDSGKQGADEVHAIKKKGEAKLKAESSKKPLTKGA